jgi:hypothetical protein
VRKIWLISALVIGLIGLPFALLRAVPPPTFASKQASSEPMIRYQIYDQKQSLVHTLSIPTGGRFQVVVASAPTLDTLENLAQQHGAIAALNGGFFDPVNAKSISYLTQQGKLVADPKQNERLVGNPALAPYLSQIFNRTEFRRDRCGSKDQYRIVLHSEPSLANCQLVDALGGGPRLLPQISLEQEGFRATVNGKVIRDAIGSNQPNARTAIGITSNGTLVWVMVAQKPNIANSGITFEALAEFMKTLGIEQAINLDGGSSSALYYQGKTIYGKIDASGQQVQRPVKSVLLVQQR